MDEKRSGVAGYCSDSEENCSGSSEKRSGNGLKSSGIDENRSDGQTQISINQDY